MMDGGGGCLDGCRSWSRVPWGIGSLLLLVADGRWWSPCCSSLLVRRIPVLVVVASVWRRVGGGWLRVWVVVVKCCAFLV